jgi:hypothetical protein
MKDIGKQTIFLIGSRRNALFLDGFQGWNSEGSDMNFAGIMVPHAHQFRDLYERL